MALQCGSNERLDVDSELVPALGARQVTQTRVTLHRVACALSTFGAAFLALAAVALIPIGGDQDRVETTPQEVSVEDAWQPRGLSPPALSPQISCALVTCGDFATTLSKWGKCEGPATSDDCFEKCCGDIKCAYIPDFSCGAESFPGLNAGLTKRHISYWKSGKQKKKCKGEENCVDVCCQGLCADVQCQAPTPCHRPFPPERCTPSTCQQQCCYGDDYCGNGLNAWTEACKQCDSLTGYCESKLNLDYETTPREEWNKAAYKAVMKGHVEPGCEVRSTPTCEKLLHFNLKTVFPFHKNGEGVSVNGLDVIAGGTQAVSGGDDKLVFIWRIADGHILRNYSAHYSAIRTISTFNDATFFCAASHTEAIVWRNSGPQDSGILAEEYTTDNPADIETTSCIGINTWETAIVGQNDSFAEIWKWKAEQTLQVPTNPKVQWKWQIDKDAGYVRWGDKFKGHPSDWKEAFTDWRKNLFGLKHRRLQSNASEDASARRLRPADRTAPWTNWFTNTRWGDVPVYYYQPDNWGPITSLAAIPFDTLFAVGYGLGSIRVWITYNGFLKSIIPQAHDGAVTAMVSAPAGNVLYSGGADGIVRMWNVFTGKFQAEMYAAHAGPVRSLAVIPGGNNIYSGHATGLLLLWIPAIQKLWCHLDTKAGSVNALAVNPAVVGQVLLALEGGEARVYEMR